MPDTPSLPRADTFREWLAQQTTLSKRSISDTLSRAKRVAAMVDIVSPTSENELAFRLQESSEFGSCSASVRSQLKRAAVLYRNFLASTAGARR